MLFAPASHSLGVLGAAPIILVLQLGQPQLLALGFAGALTIRRRAEALMVSVVRIRKKQLPTMPTLTTTRSCVHESGGCLPEPSTEDKSRSEKSGRRRRRTEKKEEGFEFKSGKKTNRRRWVHFKSRVLASF